MPLARVDASERFFSDCHREATRPDSDQRMVELLLALWLRSCARDAVGRAVVIDEDGIVAARSYMERHMEQELSLADLAEVADCSPSHFSARYRELYHEAPIASLIRLRLSHAQHLLRSTQWPVSDIAKTVGFGDAFHFSRTFKRKFGMAPSAWREQAALPQKRP